MRLSNYLLLTEKETPADADIVSHQLMLRAGLIRKLGAGLYSWLPLGYRTLKKVESIIREEMDRSGALEVFLPAVQPAELWHETDRWQTFGGQLLKITDRGGREFCFGPTHEEVITDLMRHELKSYRQLPVNLYQIQTKFRDEIRPRFGIMRAREFIMKDSYSFHTDKASLADTYQVMYDTYSRIFSRLGLSFRAVLADTGAIGGSASHEFQVLADSGEDSIFYSDESDYAANVELAEAITDIEQPPAAQGELTLVDTPQQRTIAQVSEGLKVKADTTVKMLLVNGEESPLVALILRGDHELNALKAEKLPQVASPLTFADEEVIAKHMNCEIGYLGPVNCPKDIPIIVDRSAAVLSDFVCGANQQEKHYINTNWQRDATYTCIADLRNVVEGDLSPDGKGRLKQCRGIEVGHIFQLGSKYAQAMSANVLDENGKSVTLEMGCYGIGVTRIVAAAIEQNHDQHGIIWPEPMAPFQVAIVPVNMHKSERLQNAVNALYEELNAAGIEVVLDDRKERPGVMFADMDLIGIPHRIVMSERGLDAGTFEYKYRRDEQAKQLTKQELMDLLTPRGR